MHTLNAQNFLLRSLSLVVFFNFFFVFMRLNAAKYYQWFWDTCTCIRLHVLGIVELMYWCGGKEKHCVWSVQQLFTSVPLPPIYFPLSINVRDACCVLGVGLMAGFSGLPAIGTVSILELAANNGSSWMSQASNLHIGTQFLIEIFFFLWMYRQAMTCDFWHVTCVFFTCPKVIQFETS